MQLSHVRCYASSLCRFALVLTLLFSWLPAAQAAASPIPQPLGLSQQPNSLLSHAKTINRAWLQQALHNAKPGAAIAVTSSDQGAQAAEANQSAVDRSVAITGTNPITNININILVNPDHIDDFLALLPSGDFSEADLIDLLFNNIGSLPIDINFADLGQSGLDLVNSTACDLIKQALQAQGLDQITVDLLAPIACGMISDGIDSAIGEVEALLGGGTTSLPIPSDLEGLVDSAVTEVSNLACDLVTQAINAQGLDAITTSLLADVVCTIISDNISALRDEIVAVANGGLDEAALLALATDLSSQVINAVTNLLPSLDALGVLGGDALSLVGDLIGVDISISFTVAAPGELDSDAVAQVIVTTNSGGESEEPINSCGGFALVEDVNGELTAPDFAGTLIVGTSGADELFGTPGDDLIVGLGGDDDIYGSHGNDVICGGPGVDVIDGENGDDALYGDAQADWLIGGNNNDLLYGGAGNDDLEGNNGEDLLYGEAGADVLLGGNGQDEVYGGDGADYLEGNNGNDLLDGGADVDQLYGGTGNDTLAGGAGNDELYGENGSDDLDGGDGDDYCLGGNGKNALANCETPATVTSSAVNGLTSLQVYRINDLTPTDAIRGQFLDIYLPVVATLQ